MAEHFTDRVELLRALERHATGVRIARNLHDPGHFKHERATFFFARAGTGSDIDSVVAWAQTERGGKQLPLLRDEPDGGCFRWGLCDAGQEAGK